MKGRERERLSLNEERREIRRKSIMCEKGRERRRRRKTKREATDRYTINNTDEQRRRRGLVRFQPLIYYIERENFCVPILNDEGKRKKE